MLRRDVVSCGSACAALRNSANASASSPSTRAMQARRALRHGAVGVRVERLLRQERRRVALALRQVRERELGERRGVAGFRTSTSRAWAMALSICPLVAQRGHVERPRVDRVRVVLRRSRRAPRPRPCAPRGGAAPRPSAMATSCASGASFAAAASCVLRAREIARRGEHDAEVVARLPQVGVDGDGLAQERHRPVALPVLRRLDALHHLGRPPAGSPGAAPPPSPPREAAPRRRRRRTRPRASTGAATSASLLRPRGAAAAAGAALAVAGGRPRPRRRAAALR